MSNATRKAIRGGYATRPLPAPRYFHVSRTIAEIDAGIPGTTYRRKDGPRA